MNSTTERITAELQYARRMVFSSALRKMPPSDRHKVTNIANRLYQEMVSHDSKINKTDIFRLLAAIGAKMALLDPNFAGSS